ncbi:MAG: S41 family peptidase, partial [Spirochaetaceae bacterium]|nr:S41 family peptidase [Spirochaetaceae bacterium]
IRLVTPEVESNLFTKDKKYYNPRDVIYYYLQDPQNNVHKNLLYGSLNTQTAYLHIPTFSTPQNEQLEGINDSAEWTEDFYTIIEKYLDTPYLIIDLRNNTGGDFTNGRALLQYFISQSSELTHNYRKNGPGPNDYYESVFQITPSSLHYSNQVILLVNKMTYSTSDILAIGLKELCGAHLIGISNRSETVGNPYPRELPNGWLLTLGSFNISVLGYVDGDMIDVDTQVWNTQDSYNQNRDLQLEAALDWIAAQ